ncbi:hypothetical protein GGR50DRAFT_688986 [Xylaria sp. CBS 124048]|nr:hypothetical protein GGR50DRAFT_688986 [Xylaria sp. CBS 124048]
MDPRVSTYTEPPEALIGILSRFHAPYALPLIRRLRFTRFPGGCTEYTRILWSSSVKLEDYLRYNVGDGVDGRAPFAAAYLDFTRGPETELWIYSSLEVSAGLESGVYETGKGGEVEEEEEEEKVFKCLISLLREVKREQDIYFIPGSMRDMERQSESILVGNLNEVTRSLLVSRGVDIASTGLYDKWVFRVDKLPHVEVPEMLDDGRRLLWDVVRPRDLSIAIVRTDIQRTERTLKLLPSKALYLDDGTPIAWAFLGPDSSLSSLHCEVPYRGRGFAKAVAVKLLSDRVREYGDEGVAWADVSPDNLQSQGVCRGLNGEVKWRISW